MVKRLVTVVLFLLVGLSAVALIPEAPPIRQAAVKMELPRRIAGWGGTSREASQQEMDILADDTEFEKRDYAEFPPRTTVEQLKQIAATIVLSGHDLNNSIHDPVRCARAQGFKGIEVTSKTLDLGDGKSIEIKRMSNYLEFPRDGGEPVRVPFVTYFWFVGTDHVTESHYSLRDLYRCSHPELDRIVDELVRVPGIFGARMTGAGWGGCVVALTEPGMELEGTQLLAFDDGLDRRMP